MSKSYLPKASTILVSAFLFTTLVSPAFAVGISATVEGPEVKLDASSAAAVRAKLNQKAEIRKENIQEKIASRTAVLKEKLAAFKDQQKAQIAERINANLNAINQNQTSQMQRHLDLMATILGKLESRVNEGAPDVKNSTAAQAAITEAKDTIATASAAVSEQTQKTYTIQVTTESRIRTAAKTQRDKLHKDLQTTRKAVIDAKQAVANAIRTAKAEVKEATSSGQQ